jgi:hypothetical protein
MYSPNLSGIAINRDFFKTFSWREWYSRPTETVQSIKKIIDLHRHFMRHYKYFSSSTPARLRLVERATRPHAVSILVEVCHHGFFVHSADLERVLQSRGTFPIL